MRPRVPHGADWRRVTVEPLTVPRIARRMSLPPLLVAISVLRKVGAVAGLAHLLLGGRLPAEGAGADPRRALVVPPLISY
ncbi:hypothetical protein DUHN55_36460 [Helicobacter pylori]